MISIIILQVHWQRRGLICFMASCSITSLGTTVEFSLWAWRLYELPFKWYKNLTKATNVLKSAENPSLFQLFFNFMPSPISVFCYDCGKKSVYVSTLWIQSVSMSGDLSDYWVFFKHMRALASVCQSETIFKANFNMIFFESRRPSSCKDPWFMEYKYTWCPMI